jgi:hypothetical protein
MSDIKFVTMAKYFCTSCKSFIQLFLFLCLVVTIMVTEFQGENGMRIREQGKVNAPQATGSPHTVAYKIP